VERLYGDGNRLTLHIAVMSGAAAGGLFGSSFIGSLVLLFLLRGELDLALGGCLLQPQ
jgi:hypothetical protein